MHNCEVCDQKEGCVKDDILDEIEQQLLGDKDKFDRVNEMAQKVADKYGVSVERFLGVMSFNDFLNRIIQADIQREQAEQFQQALINRAREQGDLPEKEGMN